MSVTSNFANENVSAGEYTIYRNAYNIYDSNADFSQQGGNIRYDCNTELFYLPNEDDGAESIYLDHPVVGVTWVGASIYANYFGWSIPTLEEWDLAARGNNEWLYPWGNDIDENTTPLEVPLKWTVHFEKDFIGKNTLMTEQVTRKLVGFEILEKRIARQGNEVLINGSESGFVTSGSFSPTLKKSIGFCFIPLQFPTEELIEIDIGGKLYRAKVTNTRFL